MAPPPVLKKRHSLEGKNILPVISKMKNYTGGSPSVLARLRMNVRLEEIEMDDLIQSFQQLTGNSAQEILEMAGREVDLQNMQLLLHFTIIHANEFGQPTGQDLSEVSEVQPLVKRPRLDSDTKKTTALEKRILELETQAKGKMEDSVTSLKEKVRCLASQANPSVPLLLVALEELANTARRLNYEDADVYEEMLRQAHLNASKIDIATFCLNVLGGKVSSLVTKALSKCMKPKLENPDPVPSSSGKTDSLPQSPLMGLYNQPLPPFYMPSQVSVPPYHPQMGHFGYHQFSQGSYRRNCRGSGRGQSSRGNCLFCDSHGHFIRDCEKMKAARNK